MKSLYDDRRRGEYITRSNERCRHYGIEPDRIYSSHIIAGTELLSKLESERDLIVAAEPFIGQLYGFVRGSGFFVILTNAECCILKVIGDDEILSRAFAIKMIPGAYMDERSIGTNAMGTALEEGMPVQVSGTEHFISAYHCWTCSGAPIRDADDRIIGSLDLTGKCENVHPHTLGMVVAAADSIGKILKIKRYTEELSLSKRYTETIIDSLGAGIITARLDGTVKTVSKQAAEMFGYDAAEMRGMNIADLIDDWSKIRDALNSIHPIAEEDFSINARRNKISFSVSAYPLLDSQGEVRDAILTIKELRKVRKLANRIMGRQAIYTFAKIIGSNRAFMEAVEFAKKTADSRSTVLILGESGTGKELFAQSIHNAGGRKEEAFVAINCGALPRALIESELFGYEEGAFTGAKRSGQPGKFEIADGGTIFLDEIGEMPLDLQTQLLRVIEEGTLCRIGGNRVFPVDVRIIAATNKDLRLEVVKGNFRKDLYYRLNVLPLFLPPLRERKDDLPSLIDYFMDRISRKLNKRPIRLPEYYLRSLISYEWPGNVRELENFIELIINAEDLVPLPDNTENGGTSALPDRIACPKEDEDHKTPIQTLADLERDHITRVLSIYNGNMSVTSRVLGIGRTTLYRKLEALGIECSEMVQCSEMEQVYSGNSVPF